MALWDQSIYWKLLSMVSIICPLHIPTPCSELPTGKEGLLHISHWAKIKLRKNNTRKCIVEVRNKIKGNYKGYIYCDGITEATELKKIISKIITNENIDINNISLKHGCSEFYVSYPSFEEINYNGNEKFKYDQKWDTFEKIIDSREPKRIKADKKIWGKSIEGINLSDILILNKHPLNHYKIV